MPDSWTAADADLQAMTEAELGTELESTSTPAQGAAAAIGGYIGAIEPTYRKRILEIINMLIRMAGA